MGPSSVYHPRSQKELTRTLGEFQEWNNTLVPPAPRRSISEEKFPATPLPQEEFQMKTFLVDWMKPSCKVGEILSTNISNFVRTLWNVIQGIATEWETYTYPNFACSHNGISMKSVRVVFRVKGWWLYFLVVNCYCLGCMMVLSCIKVCWSWCFKWIGR